MFDFEGVAFRASHCLEKGTSSDAPEEWGIVVQLLDSPSVCVVCVEELHSTPLEVIALRR